MIKLHHAPETRSVRIRWLLEELALDYDLVSYKLGDPAMRAPDYLAISPLGRVPALQDGDVTLFESGAIVQYILKTYGEGRFEPDASSPEYAQFLQWIHYAEGMIMPQINIIVVETLFLSPEKRSETNVARARKLLERMMPPIEAALEGRDFLCGEFSAADMMTGHATIVSTRIGGVDTSDKPNIKAYVDRLEARPALQKARSA
ncbi:MAG: glutathione S-transferase family protein [Pseudomonadota bacterium]